MKHKILVIVLGWMSVVGFSASIVRANSLLQAPDPFLGPVYYGSAQVWQMFDHHFPSLGGDDLNIDVLHYDGVRSRINGYGYDGHGGIDYGFFSNQTTASPYFAPVLAAASGVVRHAGWQNPANHRAGYGLFAKIEHPNQYMTYYGHLSSLGVRTGESIVANPETRQGIIGLSGNTGHSFDENQELCVDVELSYSCGAHLHFEVRNPQGRPVNPYGWVGPEGVMNGRTSLVGLSVLIFGGMLRANSLTSLRSIFQAALSSTKPRPLQLGLLPMKIPDLALTQRDVWLWITAP